MSADAYARIGTVTDKKELIIKRLDKSNVTIDIDTLKKAWQKPLKGL